jgi:oligopeptide transport system substrate-binding protein
MPDATLSVLDHAGTFAGKSRGFDYNHSRISSGEETTMRISRFMAVCLLALVLPCCGRGCRQETPADTFTLAVAQLTTLDPAIMTNFADIAIAGQMFEGLTTLDPKDLSVRQGIAEEWTVSPDGMTYTFKLRRSVWSDGRPLTAEDFVYSWRRVLAPSTGSQYASFLFPIRGATDFHDGKTVDPSAVGIRAVDPLTLEVVLEKPTPYFLQMTAFSVMFPVRRDCVEKHGDGWTRPENIVTNGAFVMKEYEPGNQVVLEKNQVYWDAANVRLKRVVALVISSEETAFRKFQAGELDYVRRVPIAKLAAAAKLVGFQSAPSLDTTFVRLNVTKKPLDDVRVRKALSLAVDRKRLCGMVGGGRLPARSLVPGAMPGYSPAECGDFDPAEARKLLADAAGSVPVKLQLLFSTSEDNQKVCEMLQEMWRTNLGLEVELLNQERGTFLKAMKSLEYQMAYSNWTADYVDPTTFLDCFVGGSGNNRTGWRNGRYDELLREAAGDTDPRRRAGILARAEGLLVVDEAPIVPLFFGASNFLLNPRVEGFHGNALDTHSFKGVAKGAR